MTGLCRLICLTEGGGGMPSLKSAGVDGAWSGSPGSGETSMAGQTVNDAIC